jgi:glycolate oxidase FAD binding subunit
MTLSAASLSRLEGILGSKGVRSDPSTLVSYVVEGVVPSAVAQPANATEVAEAVRFAATEKLAVIPCGGRTKLCIGMPPRRYDLALDLTHLSHIAYYDPGDLTVSAEAGMPLVDLDSALAAQGQFLPLGPPFSARATVGGAIASGVDSPLRQFYGTARDFVIGAEFVTGSGGPAKSGGRVVKNVTGYDLHKLLIGSLGTLAVIIRINFKTFPLPPQRRSFVACFADSHGALDLRRRIAASALSPSTLEIVSPDAARLILTAQPEGTGLLPVPTDASSHPWILCTGFEGTPEVCDRCARELNRLAEEARAARIHLFQEGEASALQGAIGRALPCFLRASPAAVIFKISALPGQFAAVFGGLGKIAESASLPSALLGRGSGTVYFALLPAAIDGQMVARLSRAAGAVFDLAAAQDGHATILWCPPELKRLVNIWGPARPDFALMRSLKDAFDPHGILSPGRFVGGL